MMSKVLLLILLAACAGCGGPDLEVVGEPLLDAFEEIQDFATQVDGGLSNGEVLDRWPEVKADYESALRDYEPVEELEPFEEAVEDAADAWQETRDAVYEYIQEDGDQFQAGAALTVAQLQTETAEQWRAHFFEGALSPEEMEAESEAAVEAERSEQAEEYPGSPAAVDELLDRIGDAGSGSCIGREPIGYAVRCEINSFQTTVYAGLTEDEIEQVVQEGDVVGPDWVIRVRGEGIARNLRDELGGEIREG